MISDNINNLFDTSHLKTDLKKRSLRSGAVTLTSQVMQFIIQLGSTMILARILTPDDYGMMAMVVAITGFAGLFLNLGLSTATVQQTEINHAQVSTLFWINAGMGFLLMLIIAGLSPVIAWFYSSPQLAWVVLSLSSIFFINGLVVQQYALLNRQMRFLSLAAIQVGSMLIGVIVAIYFALMDYGYWALVFNNITLTFCSACGAWIAAWWLPSLPRRTAGIGSMVKFGSDIMGFNIVNYFARNLDNILIGRFYGSGPLGFYSKAYQLLMTPIQNLRDPLTRVAMPALSRLQNEPENYRNYYMKFVSILAFISMPLVAFLFVCSDQVINIVLGPQWGEASELFRILALVAFIQPVLSTRGVVLISTGKSRKYLVLGVIGAIITCVSFMVGLPWGAKGVAMGYTVNMYLKIFPFLYLSFRDTPIRVVDFMKAVYRPFFSSLAMGVTIIFLLQVLQNFNDVVLVAVCLPISVLVYLLTIITFSNGKQDIREYFAYGKIIFNKS